MTARCKACGSSSLQVFYDGGTVPAHSCVLLDDAVGAATYPTGEVVLEVCGDCAFIQNGLFDDALIDYGQDCEESQAFSPAFNAFAGELARDLVDRYRLAGKEVVEIGCGKGDFLSLLVEAGIGSGTGVDPGYRAGRQSDHRLDFVVDLFENVAGDLEADLVVCRHTLEHIAEVRYFTEALAGVASRRSGAGVFVEVPDTVRVLTEGAFWDVYHEHCSYFTPGSLDRLLAGAGLTPDIRTAFSDQYLLAYSGRNERGRYDSVDEIAALAVSFGERVHHSIDEWRSVLGSAVKEGRRPVLWGGGSKAIAFLAALDLPEPMAAVVDINPYKQGKFLAGSGLEVIEPRGLLGIDPGLVVVMNGIYTEEITESLHAMGLRPDVTALG
ncbi:MAG: class I SAM-dependent methyltransferase [Acidimicrobiia bacterium]|nr:class I SAM-dependent methyltransferase [Acidimicrobiia bacterium]MDH4306680.1 class I SAM-dependent methyltransferase [Acidimicrobiia bacterium]